MDLDEAHDEAEDIEMAHTGHARIEAYRRRADELTLGEPGRAVFLGYLADHLKLMKSFDEARAVYDELAADGGRSAIDARAGRFDLELQVGDEDQAAVLQKELLAAARQDTLDIDMYLYIGEALEEAGRLREALRWFTMPIRDLDPHEIDQGEYFFVHGRYRVRRELGLAMDGYDEVSQAIRNSVDPNLD